MLRFARHRQGQDSRVCTRWHARVCRGSLRHPQLPTHHRFGYRRPELTPQPCTDRRKGFLPALNDRVSTLGANR